MKSKRLIAMAIAASFAVSAGALAGGKFHQQKGAEVRTPAAVSESGSSVDSIGVGASSSASGSGSVGFDASSGSTTEYWHLGGDSAVGASPDMGASGSIGASSSPTNEKPISD